LGIIIPALFAFLSEGYVFFAVTGMILISSKARHRLGKEFLGLTDFEYSKIAVAGPMACIIFALILSLVNTLSVAVVWLIKINIALAIANMLPIPLITGSVAFFGSKFFYLFSFVFIIFASILMWYINFFFVIFFALILASLLVTIAYYFGEVK
jgi:Zn-dependent protease